MIKLGDKIKSARKAQGMTQADLAERIGVHRSTVANYELTRRIPSLDELKSISKILHVDMNYLAEGNEVDNQQDLLTRANDVFADLNISNEDKDAIFRDIMEIYMKGKIKNDKQKNEVTRKNSN